MPLMEVCHKESRRYVVMTTGIDIFEKTEAWFHDGRLLFLVLCFNSVFKMNIQLYDLAVGADPHVRPPDPDAGGDNGVHLIEFF